MSGTAAEMHGDTVVALHQWLLFLDEKEDELKAQLERLRNKDGEGDNNQANGNPPPGVDPWL